MKFFPAILLLAFFNVNALSQPQRTNNLTTIEPIPPVMSKRVVEKSKCSADGEQIVLNDRGTELTLFLRHCWNVKTNNELALTIHFHSAPWFAIEEHYRRGLMDPLVAMQLGEGSSKYRVPFEDRERFGRILKLVAENLPKVHGPNHARITAVDISSFSAGYGAVREIVKSPEYLKLIRRIVLCDSIYAGFESPQDHKPSRENIEPWLPFVKAAAHGEKTFLLTHSQVPTGAYASSGECAAALIAAVGASIQKIPASSIPAASDPDFPLLYRSDFGNFHVWGYGGEDGQAHMTHMRHLGDSWMALDKAEKNSTVGTAPASNK